MFTNFLVAGSVGVVANYALFSRYTPASMDLFLKEMATVVQPIAALKGISPALIGFLGGTLLLLVCNYLKVRVVRFLLEYDGWLLHPKRPINKLWYMLMKLLLGSKNRGIGNYQDFLPSLPVPALTSTCNKYLESVKPLLTEEEFQETKQAVKEFVKHDGKKLQWLLKFRSWKKRNWMAEWWTEFIYLRQRTPICFNSNYYASCQSKVPTKSQLDRAASTIFHQISFAQDALEGRGENAMATKVVPFCHGNYKYLISTTRIPGEEKDEIVCYSKEKPTHGVVFRQGKFYLIEVISSTGKQHSLPTIRRQLEKIIAKAGSEYDRTGVQNFTSLPRTKWARLRQQLVKNPVNKQTLHLIDSAVIFMVLETDGPDMSDLAGVARHLFHGDGYSRWFDKSVSLIVFPNGVLGANVEHTPLDATVCGHMWEYILTEERYDEEGRCIAPPSPVTSETPEDPIELKWEVEDLREELAEATSHLSDMIKDSDMESVTPSYGKRFPKQCKISPDGWFQMALQLAYYRLHHKFVLTYESATTRLYYEGRTETIRPMSTHSVAFVKAMDDPNCSKEDIKKLLKQAVEVTILWAMGIITLRDYMTSFTKCRLVTCMEVRQHCHLYCMTKYQCNYKLEAMRGMGVDRHLFGLYLVAKGLKLDPLPKMFTDNAFNFSFLLSTSQTPVKTTDRWRLEDSTALGGFGTVSDEGYGISYIVVGEDTVNFSIHSKRSCADTSSIEMARALYQAFEDMKNLYN